ncbi:MAG TPA: T9SS type A sorting domain-containing protein [Flavobacteriales bacterium]|nr:T9SS type A sorting domain-containing protein [Flavobacteriales bacterium]
MIRTLTQLSITGLIAIAPGSLQGQQVYKGFGTSNSTFLLGNLSALRTQCLYLPGDLVNPTGGAITRLYYRYGTTAQTTGVTLGNLQIKLGLTNEVAFANGNTYFTGLTPVLQAASFTIPPGTTGDWFPIDLQTPFLYNPNRTLIIEIEFATTTAGAFGTYGTTPNQGRKLYSGTSGTTTGTTTSSTWQDMGFDLDIGAGIVRMETFSQAVWPNPAQDAVNFRLPAGTAGVIELIDANGRVVKAQAVNATSTSTISIIDLAPGLYTARAVNDGGHMVLGRVVKE